MKTAAKIIVYCLWFGFVLFLSVYHFWPLVLIRWIEPKIGIKGFSPTLDILGASILWFSFICLLAWLPVWLVKKRGVKTSRLLGGTAIFLITLLVCLVGSGTIWQIFLPEKIYNCTDDNLFGFLRPGDWIHGDYVTVSKINPSDPMDKPDSIKEGWSVGKLWFAWFAFIVASVAISASLTFLTFRSRKPKIAQTISP
jgi:hypothetical protein